MIIDYCNSCGRRAPLENELCSPCRSKVESEPELEVEPGNVQVTETKFVRDRIIQFGRDNDGNEYSRFRYTTNNSGLTSYANDGESQDEQRSHIRDTSNNFSSWKISK